MAATTVALPTPTVTATATAIPSATLGASVVTAITPGTVTNDRPAALTLTGANFADGLAVTIGGQPLTDVRMHSATRLTATLPAGLCPGTYAVSVTDPRGARTTGGDLAVQGVRAVTTSPAPAGRPVTLNGRAQQIRVPLPTVHLQDTTCGQDDWRLSFALSPFGTVTGAGKRGSLRLRSLSLDDAAGHPALHAPLSLTTDQTEATLLVRRAGRASAVLQPFVEVQVPSHGAAGQYRMSVAVTLGEAP
jgi:hypothetical protein